MEGSFDEIASKYGEKAVTKTKAYVLEKIRILREQVALGEHGGSAKYSTAFTRFAAEKTTESIEDLILQFSKKVKCLIKTCK